MYLGLQGDCFEFSGTKLIHNEAKKTLSRHVECYATTKVLLLPPNITTEPLCLHVQEVTYTGLVQFLLALAFLLFLRMPTGNFQQASKVNGFALG